MYVQYNTTGPCTEEHETEVPPAFGLNTYEWKAFTVVNAKKKKTPSRLTKPKIRYRSSFGTHIYSSKIPHFYFDYFVFP